MVEVTKEQIEEVIKRFQSYSYWFYFSSEAEETFRKQCLIPGSKIAKFSISEEGFYRIDLNNGHFCLYRVMMVLRPVKEKGSLDNFVSMTNITTSPDISEEDLKFCKSLEDSFASIFLQSIAMKFFRYLADNQRTRLVQVLSDLVPYPVTEKKNE